MLIKIINGNYGYRVGQLVKVKTKNDPPFDVSEEEAHRLERLGVAEIMEEIPEGGESGNNEGNSGDNGSREAEENPEGSGNCDTEENAEDKVPAYGENFTNSELQAIAKEYGIDVSTRAPKAELIKALDEFFSDMPVLEAEDPE